VCYKKTGESRFFVLLQRSCKAQFADFPVIYRLSDARSAMLPDARTPCVVMASSRSNRSHHLRERCTAAMGGRVSAPRSGFISIGDLDIYPSLNVAFEPYDHHATQDCTVTAGTCFPSSHLNIP